MATKSNITVEYVRSILDYNPETGVITWKAKTSNRVKIGDVAGSVDKAGYKKIGINGTDMYCHRLAMLIVYGSIEGKEVDHINGNKLDNRLTNLRLVSKSQNMQNMKVKKSNKLGIKGVSAVKNKYIAQIMKSKKTIWLGSFNCPAAASFAYQIAADIYFGKHARSF